MACRSLSFWTRGVAPLELQESWRGTPGTSDPMQWSPGELARTGEVVPLTGEIRRKIRAVISCQQAGPRLDARGPSTGPGQKPGNRALAVKDNRVDNQFRLTGVIEVVVSA